MRHAIGLAARFTGTTPGIRLRRATFNETRLSLRLIEAVEHLVNAPANDNFVETGHQGIDRAERPGSQGHDRVVPHERRIDRAGQVPGLASQR